MDNGTTVTTTIIPLQSGYPSLCDMLSVILFVCCAENINNPLPHKNSSLSRGGYDFFRKHTILTVETQC